MTRVAYGFAVTAVLAYAAVCALIFLQQRSLMYFPTPPSPLPAGATSMTLAADGAQVHVTVFQAGRPDALLYFGGNAEDVNGSLPELATAFPDHAIYLMQYRGYGASTGTPTERVLVQDAIALYDMVKARHGRIAVAGRSLGSGVAVQLAGARPVARLVLITPFDSMRSVAAAHYSYLPVRWLMRDGYDSADHAGRITAPTMLIAAANDEIIPRASTEALFARFPKGVAVMKVIDGVGHNTISASPHYIPALQGAGPDR